jgi:hypothetical protein
MLTYGGIEALPRVYQAMERGYQMCVFEKSQGLE